MPTFNEQVAQARSQLDAERTWETNRLRMMNDPEYRQRVMSQATEDPWIDPTSAFAGGFGGNIVRLLRQPGGKILAAILKSLGSGAAGAAADYPVGLSTEIVGQRYPQLALPFNVAAGMGSGMTFERMLEGAINDPQALRRTLGQLADQTGMVEAWHGSPHKFDKFDMSKVGTGEGAQAFGHGLYFTSKKDIAEHYAKVKPQVNPIPRKTFLGIEVDSLSPEYRAATLLDQGKSLAQARFDVRVKIEDARTNEEKDVYKKILDVLERADSKKDFGVLPPHENVYRATLFPGRNDEVWLDWDKKLKDQPNREKIEKALTALGLNAEGMENFDGQAVYASVSSATGGFGRAKDPQQAGSAFLRKHGIDGIRYPAGSLSGGGDGTNYVVFDDSVIEINAINDKPLK